jgi:prophage regulatory protein
MTCSILRLPTVIQQTGKSRTSIYAEIKLGLFPKPVKLGARSVGWLSAEIDEWIQKCVAESRQTQGVKK